MKVLIGYDGSNVAKDVLELSRQFAKVFKAEVFIVTSLTQEGPALQKAEIDKAESQLANFKASFGLEDIACETYVSVTYRTPGEDLVNFAENNNIDYIFIGIRKRSKVGKFIFGSNAQYIILEAPCPVITVK